MCCDKQRTTCCSRRNEQKRERAVTLRAEMLKDQSIEAQAAARTVLRLIIDALDAAPRARERGSCVFVTVLFIRLSI